MVHHEEFLVLLQCDIQLRHTFAILIDLGLLVEHASGLNLKKLGRETIISDGNSPESH